VIIYTADRHSFRAMNKGLRRNLLDAPDCDVGEWHSQDISGRPELVTQELENVTFDMHLPAEVNDLIGIIEPNMPWAEDHFQERVSGNPLNPPPSASWWPYAQQGHAEHTDENEQFSHTYPERFWPKYAGANEDDLGIRYAYGDLMDVVDLLHKSPSTRQAYLPVWFPEDTGALSKQRVPCSLGYHFLIRGNQLNVTYMIRSCDYVRHFRDDVYLAARLAQWVRYQLVTREGPDDLPVPLGLNVGRLTMHIMSLHIFKGDIPKLEREA
jgi:hypothetical protein